ncbi:RidA family protein [Pseudomonas moorei]|nr:RidA family protein [Pseudomonas moorei]
MTIQPSSTGSAFQQYVVTDIGVGKLIHISGLTSRDEAPFNIEEQAQIIFDKMKRYLEEQGGELSDLVKINAYIVDMRDYDAYNAVRNRVFSALKKLPASATIGGAELVRADNRIEIEGVAFIPNRQ